MKTKKPIEVKCIYCYASVSKTDAEGVCVSCHKVNDEQSEEHRCVFCDRAINPDGDSNYIDGDGYACYDCSSYCDDCDRAHHCDDIHYCNVCERSTCAEHNNCSMCDETICKNCGKTCSICKTDTICSDCVTKKASVYVCNECIDNEEHLPNAHKEDDKNGKTKTK